MLKVEHFPFFSFISSRFYMEFAVYNFFEKKKIPSLRFISIHSQFFPFFLCFFYIFWCEKFNHYFLGDFIFYFHAFPRSDAFTSLEPYPNGFVRFFFFFSFKYLFEMDFHNFFPPSSSSIHHSFLLLFYLN